MANKEELSKVLMHVVPLVLASTLAGYYIPKGLKKLEQHSRKGKVTDKWLKVLAKYPQLASDPKSKDNFDTLAQLYPTLADHPEAIISALRIAQDYSTEGIDPNTLKTLADAERGVSQSYPGGGSEGKEYFNISKTISDISKDAPEAVGAPGGITWSLI